MKTGTLTWNGENSLTDHGVYVSGPGAHNAAEADVTAYQIPGRNGDLVISNNRFKNIEVRYPAFIAHGFAGKEQDVRNWLRSSVGYRRLEDTYDQTHFRMGRPTGELEFSPVRPDGANFEIAFDCKPQRFLKNGETEEEVIPLIGEETQSAYSFRAISPQDGRNAEFQTLVGGTVNWNQLFNKANFRATATSNGITFTNNGDGSITVNGTATAQATFIFQIGAFTATKNHKYLFPVTGLEPNMFFGFDGDGVGFSVQSYATRVVVSPETGAASYSYIRVPNGSTISNKKIYPQIIDLTAMFGSTIADYIYSLEQSTAGAGVAWFRKLFPKPYYAYNPGELLSVNAVGKKTVGFNAYDSSVGEAKVVGGQQYEITGTYTSLSLDGETITPVSGKITPSASGTLTVTGGGADTCVHLVWDGSRDGEFEEYEAHEYALDDLTLRGIPKLDASNNLYYDGDTYEADGTVTRKYRMVALSSLSWLYNSNYHIGYCYIAGKATGRTNLLSDRFAVVDKGYATMVDGEIAGTTSDNGINIKIDSTTSAGTFLSAIEGLYLVYELATPTTEQADPYTQPFVVDDFGTEAFIDGEYEAGDRDVEIPVGNVTRYQKRGLTITNPTPFDARPLLRVVNPASGDVININGQTITFSAGHTGELFIDCELMDAYANGTNANSKITLSDFPVLKPGDNIVTWSGSGELYIAPRWWEL